MNLNNKTLIFITLALFVQISHAQDLPSDVVDAHNVARAAVGVPAIAWNDMLAAYAESYAVQRKGDCAFIFSGGPYGEILWYSPEFVTGKETVETWVEEKDYYDYDTNTCEAGHHCELYTQVVWHSSIWVGCSRVACDNGGYFSVCSYDRPGNVVGEKPY